MKKACFRTHGSVAGPSRARKSGVICLFIDYNVVENKCVENKLVCCALFRVGYIDTVGGPSICAVDIKGLLKVVPEPGAGDKGSEYCIDGFAIDRYGELLTDRQQMYPDLCTPTIIVRTHQLVRVLVPYK